MWGEQKPSRTMCACPPSIYGTAACVRPRTSLNKCTGLKTRTWNVDILCVCLYEDVIRTTASCHRDNITAWVNAKMRFNKWNRISPCIEIGVIALWSAVNAHSCTGTASTRREPKQRRRGRGCFDPVKVEVEEEEATEQHLQDGGPFKTISPYSVANKWHDVTPRSRGGVSSGRLTADWVIKGAFSHQTEATRGCEAISVLFKYRSGVYRSYFV